MAVGHATAVLMMIIYPMMILIFVTGSNRFFKWFDISYLYDFFEILKQTCCCSFDEVVFVNGFKLEIAIASFASLLISDIC